MNPPNQESSADGGRPQDNAGSEQARLSAIFNNSANAIAFTNPATGKIVDVNDTWVRASGFPRDQVIGKTGGDLGLWARASDRQACVERLEKTGAALDVEVELIMRGERRPYLICARVLELAGEKHVLWELRDISDLKRAEADKERMRAQLFQARKLQSVGQLAGGIAHDFNNILSGILMQLGVLEQKSHPDPETSELLKEMGAEARRASSLVKQLLMFSRQSVLGLEVLDLNTVITNLLKLLGRLIGEQITLTFNPSPGIPLIEADASMLEQIAVNLLVNSRDAMPKGGSIVISTESATFTEFTTKNHPDRRPGRFVVLTVKDFGVGMDRQTLERMFEPFFTTKPPGHGTGLGLATVHGIVGQHHGWIEPASEPGKGTTIRIYLPATDKPPKTVSRAKPAPLQRGSETILLVEDEPALRRMSARALRSLGYVVIEATDAQEALDQWRLHRDEIHLVLTDLVMPRGMNGQELIRTLRAEKPDLKAILSSGYSLEMIESGAPSDSNTSYIAKPYGPSVLAAALRERLHPATAPADSPGLDGGR